jgi:hypothetical protein
MGGAQRDRSGKCGVGALRFLLGMLSNQLACRGLASSATAAHGQLHLHFAQAAGPLVDSAANLTIGNPVAQTNIHRDPYALPANQQTMSTT